jgi:phage gpG-like protein
VTQTVEVLGADRLAATMGRAAHDLGDLGAANSRAGEAVANPARSAAPRVTGALAASIRTDRDRDGATVSATVVYASVINYGWAAHGIAANPFLTGTFERQERTVVDVYAAELDNIVGRIRGQ